MPDKRDFFLAPVVANESLPPSVQNQKLFRWSAPKSKRADQSASKREAWPLQKSLIHDQVLKTMHADNSFGIKFAYRSTHSGYWGQKASTTYKATLGHVLQQPERRAKVGQSESGRQRPEDESGKGKPVGQKVVTHAHTTVSPFLTQTANLPTVLSYLQRAEHKDTPLEQPQRLIAKLVPSPWKNMAFRDLDGLPKIEMSFAILQKSSSREKDLRAQQFAIDAETMVIVTSIRCIILERVCDLILPSKATDIRVVKRDEVSAHIEEALRNKKNNEESNIGAFVQAIVSSMRAGGDLSAPSHVSFNIAHWMMSGSALNDAKKGKKTAKKNAVKVPYFFTGFEYEDQRVFVPSTRGELLGDPFDETFTVAVSDIEGGFTGGRRMELAIVPKQSVVDDYTTAQNMTKQRLKEARTGARNTEKMMPLLETAFSVLELVDQASRGEIQAQAHENEPSTSRLQNSRDSSSETTRRGFQMFDIEGNSNSGEEQQEPDAEYEDSEAQRTADAPDDNIGLHFEKSRSTARIRKCEDVAELPNVSVMRRATGHRPVSEATHISDSTDEDDVGHSASLQAQS